MSDQFDAAGFETFMAEVSEAVAAGLETARLGLIERGLSEADAVAAIRAFPVDPYIAGIANRAFRAMGGRRRATITAHSSLADAMLDLHCQIVARFGDHPDTLEDLEIRTMPCPDQRGGPDGTALVAHPRAGINADGSNLLVAYIAKDVTEGAR